MRKGILKPKFCSKKVIRYLPKEIRRKRNKQFALLKNVIISKEEEKK